MAGMAGMARAVLIPRVKPMADAPGETEESASDRLARSRGELRRILEPEHEDADPATGQSAAAFPRSAIMKAITRHRGATGLALFAVGLAAARPRLAIRLLRYLPVGAITKTLVSRVIVARQAKKG
jgi:hypothetical protein